jgi:valyl-tRNA synthetase
MTSDARSESLIPMPPAYDPKLVEEARYRWWEEKGYFRPEAIQSEPGVDPFVVILPPPNVTGRLHLGHALTATVEDTLSRWHRMRSQPTLWLPGIDHAGIATQFVVEKALAAEGLDRRKMGREKFLERVWAWVRETGDTIKDQHRRLGASVDWTRERFTLDEGPSRAVAATFNNLHGKGLIYRGERIINWCPRCHTVLSDLETEYEDAQGSLWHIKYEYADGSGRSVTVATTRPETLLGDTAVAVHPEDGRYRDLVGKTVVLPVVGRQIAVIADEYVDREFGTGALKITPAHDPNDFEIGKRHGLDIIDVMNPDGTLNAHAGAYEGVDRFEARDRIVEQLQAEGLLDHVEPYANRVGHCYRCSTIVEPRVSIQWFVDTPPLAEPAAAAVRDGRIKIVPERFGATYLNWMENIRDWCISRQLWWGHRIPAWYCAECDGDQLRVVLAEPVTTDDGTPVPEASYPDLKGKHGLSHSEIVRRADRIDVSQGATPIVALDSPEKCPQCGGSDLVQDPDVLDTWFSSALWPHSTLGWPDETAGDLMKFYPTSVMETGYDILFFWVARMIMMGLENTGEVPFRTVYLHGLIRDAQRQKMSKTRGNVIDPLDTIDEYGTDALRMAITIATTPGNDIALSPGRMEAGRNFANKLWNGARYVVRSLEDVDAESVAPMPRPTHREDRWIVSRLQHVTASVAQMLDDFQLGQAEQVLRDFLWEEFFDWYIELAKVRLRSGDQGPVPYLTGVLEQSVRLLHPFMPFVTEEIWQNLTARIPSLAGGVESIMVARYPRADESLIDDGAEREMRDVLDLVRAVRNTRAELKIDPGRPVETVVDGGESTDALDAESEAIRALARVEPMTLLAPGEARPDPQQVKTTVLGRITVMLPLAGLVDSAAERDRLRSELEDARSRAENLDKRLANESFTSRAPAEVVEKERARLAETRGRMTRLEEELGRLSE